MPPEDNLTETEMRDLMDYDPFKVEPEPEQTPTEPEPSAASEADTAPADSTTPEPTSAPAPASAPTSAPATEPTPPTSAVPAASAAASPAGGTVEVGILQKLVESQSKQIETLTKQLQERIDPARQAPGGSPTAPPDSATAEGLPSYDFEIPDALVDGLSSDDPRERKLALRALVKGTATAVHQEMMRQIEPRFKNMPTELESRFETKQKEIAERERIRTDFFSAFPELNRPELAQFVGNIQQAVLAETGLKEWSPTLRDAIGNRARQILGMAMRAPAAAPPGAPSVVRPAVPAPPPAMHGSNTRPPVVASSNVDEVWELVMKR